MHHVSLLIGDKTTADRLISQLEKNEKLIIHTNPDFSRADYENFTIDEARALKAAAETRPMSQNGHKIFVLVMNAITVEAQNALLKLLEEPPEYARFYLIIPSSHLLLPTVKSRLSLVGNSKTQNDASVSKEATSFLEASKPERLEIVKDLLEEISKEKRPKQDAINFLNNVQAAVYDKFGPKDGLNRLATIETARTYMNDRAPSLKMLLEYVALNI